MSKVKYRVREYNPTSAQQGSHSFFAEAVINNEITNSELADKIAARTGVKAYEVTTVIAAIADIVSEEVLESNRISLADHTGTKMVSIYPKVNGSVSDADIERETTAAHTADPSVPVRTRAEESDLTTDRLNWVLGATIGVKFSKQFALSKQAQKVKMVATDTAIPNDDDPAQGGNSGDNNGGNQQGGGSQDTGGGLEG